MLCFDASLKPSPWTPQRHALAIVIGDETFALAVARRDERPTIVHLATHALSPELIDVRTSAVCAAYDLRTVYALDRHLHLPPLSPLIRLRAADIEPSIRIAAMPSVNPWELDAMALAGSVVGTLSESNPRKPDPRIRRAIWG